MGQLNDLHTTENGKVTSNKSSIYSFILIFSCYQTGCGDLDNRPKIRDDLPPLKKKLYMDEALSKISKFQMN